MTTHQEHLEIARQTLSSGEGLTILLQGGKWHDSIFVTPNFPIVHQPNSMTTVDDGIAIVRPASMEHPEPIYVRTNEWINGARIYRVWDGKTKDD